VPEIMRCSNSCRVIEGHVIYRTVVGVL